MRHSDSMKTAKQKDRPRIPKVGEAKRGMEGYLVYLLRQASVAVRNNLDRSLSEDGLTLAQFSSLTMVRAYDGLSNAELARLTMLTPQTTNEVVRGLEERGLIVRTPHRTHGKILRLSITEGGRELLARCRKRSDRI